MRISLLRVAAGAFAVALIGLMCWSAVPKASSAATLQVAQQTPAPTDTSSPDQNMNTTPTTTTNPNTTPNTTTPSGTMNPGVPTYNGKPAGTNMLNDNPNGPSWLSKFARNPGPDTSGTMTIHRHMVRHVRPAHPPKP